MRVFIDTNLWAYRLDQRETSKRLQVQQWLSETVAEHDVVISTQVLMNCAPSFAANCNHPFPLRRSVPCWTLSAALR